jgi:hypothetical protein
VRAARAYRPSLFSIFPATRGRRACRISFRPAPFAPAVHVPGECETSVRTVRAFIDHQMVAIVSFTERWQRVDSGNKAMAPPRHTWWVYERLGPGVRVLGSCDLESGSPFGASVSRVMIRASRRPASGHEPGRSSPIARAARPGAIVVLAAGQRRGLVQASRLSADQGGSPRAPLRA